jgi:iron complex transport system substrate-binding protein
MVNPTMIDEKKLLALLVIILVIGAVSIYNFYTMYQLNQRIEELNVNLNAMAVSEVLKDAYGRTVIVIPQGVKSPHISATIVKIPPKRIVSFAPSITETLFFLGLGDKVVAVTKWCDWPQEVLDKKGIGNLTVFENVVEPEIEKVVATNPDLILATTLMKPESVAKLEALGLPVVAIDYGKSLDDVYAAIKLVGKVTGVNDHAENLIINLKENITKVSNAITGLPKPKVFWMAWHEPLMSAGGPSWINALIQAAGGENIFSDVNIAWPTVGPEEVLIRNPDVILFSEGHPGILNVNDLLNLFPTWIEVKAVKEGKVFAAPSFVTHPGPRLAEAAKILAELIYGIKI